MKVFGIIGGAGSGKTTVADIISECFNVYRIDLDLLGHRVLTINEVIDELLMVFGDKILAPDKLGQLGKKKQVDRKALGQLVFNNKKHLDQLNAISHPNIKKLLFKEMEKARQLGYEYCIIDGYVIVDLSIDKYCDYLIFVDAPEEVRIRRLVDKRGLDEERAKSIILSQINLQVHKNKADYIIDSRQDRNKIKDEIHRIMGDELK